MTRLRPAQRSDRLLELLLDAGFEFVVVGGFAAIAHGSTRSTRVLDVVAPMTPENLGRLLRALRPHSPRHVTRPDLGVVSQTPEQLSAHRLLLLMTDLGRLDVLGTVEPIGGHGEVEAVGLELLPGRVVRVITRDQLIAIKAHVGRPQDLEVVRELRALEELGRRDGR